MTFNSTATKAYITTTNNNVDDIDTSTLHNLAQLPVVQHPAGFTLSPTGSFLLVTSPSTPALSVINALTDIVVGTLPVNVPAVELALAP
jgi:DNA-binding beta-propeller fold protein YncE